MPAKDPCKLWLLVGRHSKVFDLVTRLQHITPTAIYCESECIHPHTGLTDVRYYAPFSGLLYRFVSQVIEKYDDVSGRYSTTEIDVLMRYLVLSARSDQIPLCYSMLYKAVVC